MNNFTDYWGSLSPSEKNILAEKAISSYNTLSQISNRHRGVGMNLGVRLVAASKLMASHSELTMDMLVKQNTGTS